MNDNEIINLFQERSEQAISELDVKYGNQSRRMAAGLSGSREDGEECTSDGELAVWNTVPPQNPLNLPAYFFTIVRRIACKRFREITAEKRGGRTLIVSELDECAGAADTLMDEVKRRELVRALNNFLGKLSSESKIIFMRRYWYGDDIPAISALVGMSETGVRSKLYRLRKELKEFLEKEGII